MSFNVVYNNSGGKYKYPSLSIKSSQHLSLTFKKFVAKAHQHKYQWCKCCPKMFGPSFERSDLQKHSSTNPAVIFMKFGMLHFLPQLNLKTKQWTAIWLLVKDGTLLRQVTAFISIPYGFCPDNCLFTMLIATIGARSRWLSVCWLSERPCSLSDWLMSKKVLPPSLLIKVTVSVVTEKDVMVIFLVMGKDIKAIKQTINTTVSRLPVAENVFSRISCEKSEDTFIADLLEELKGFHHANFCVMDF